MADDLEIAPPTPEEAALLRRVLDAVRRIRHGYIQLTVQDARVVQIDRTEKERLA
ncbi:MAG TPA: YezD family protein [Chloroflexota bacterium]|jgi:hypothetical protein